MKSVISFCIFAAIFMQDSTLAQFAGIKNLKDTIKSVTDDLSRYDNRLISNLRTNLNNLRVNQLSNVNNAVTSAESNIKNTIAVAKNEGRNAEHCYEPTRQRLTDASRAAYSALDKCTRDQLDTLKPVEQDIESLLKTEQLLLLNLDGIAISCATGNIFQAQLCVAQKLSPASQTVKDFQNTADLLKHTGDSLSSLGETNAIRCFQTPINEFYGDVSSARIFATNCAKEAAK